MADTQRAPGANRAWNLLGYLGIAGLVVCVALVVQKIFEVF